MDKMVYKIALAGLLHDMGKFAERAKMELEPGYENNNSGLYQPDNNPHKRPTHKHALYTAAFVERFAGHIPVFDDKADAAGGNSLINLAAMHHKPETALQWIIAQSDRLSSGFDRQVFDGDDDGTAIRDFRKTRLIPIAEELRRGDEFYKSDSRDSYNYRYPLGKLSPETVFAHQRNNAVPDSNEKAIAEYAGLFEQFAAFDGDEVGVAGTGADEPYFSGHQMSFP